ncbi:MAG: Vms1/Ankzf1 family peptidyl-tRNA hydrolase [Vicinamibacterales bacterium]
MAKTTSALATPLREQLDRLARFEPTDLPVLSLYLDRRPNGRGTHDSFLRKALSERAGMLQGEGRKSFERDTERIRDYLDNDVRKSANGLAIFACAGAGDFFEAVQLDAPIPDHWLFIGSVPHLYPLARVNDQFPRYAALILDTNSARLFVFGLGATEARHDVTSVKTRKSSMGGWSQARFQRRIEHFHEQHMKEVADLLDRVVREDDLTKIVIACDDVARPLLLAQLPQHLQEKIVDITALDAREGESAVLRDTLDVLRQHDADTDVARVQALRDAWLGGGLGVVGPDSTLRALSMAQVEELLITASPDRLAHARQLPPGAAPGPVDVDTSAAAAAADADQLKLADELVTRAQQQSARIRFIEDPALLQDVGGVGAILRFRI